ESHAAEDKKFEELIQARNQADGLIHATRKSITEAGDKVQADEKEKIEATITALEAAIKADNLEDIQARTKDLTDASAPMAQRMYAEAQAAQQGGADAGAGGNKADDAVDAEFEEVKDDK